MPPCCLTRWSLLVFLMLLTGGALAARTPQQEFLNGIKTDFEKLLLFSRLPPPRGMSEKMVLENILKTGEGLLKDIKNNPVKGLDLGVMGEPVARYVAAAKVYHRIKPEKKAARKKAFGTLSLWRSFLASHPILTTIAVQYQIIKGHDYLLDKEFGKAENFFNAALDGLKGMKQESDRSLQRTADKIRDQVEVYLVNVRREEEMPKGQAISILKQTARLFDEMLGDALAGVEASLP